MIKVNTFCYIVKSLLSLFQYPIIIVPTYIDYRLPYAHIWTRLPYAEKCLSASHADCYKIPLSQEHWRTFFLLDRNKIDPDYCIFSWECLGVRSHILRSKGHTAAGDYQVEVMRMNTSISRGTWWWWSQCEGGCRPPSWTRGPTYSTKYYLE